MAKKSGVLKILAIVLSLTMLASALSFPLTAEAQGTVTVSVNAPSLVLQDSVFNVNIDITNVENLNACDYEISYNSLVLELKGVSSGLINGVTIPASWNIDYPYYPGRAKVVQHLGPNVVASGSGYLARLSFHVIGSSAQTSQITLSNGIIGDGTGNPIPAQWQNDSVQVTYHQVANVSASAPAEVTEKANFNVAVNVSWVQNFDTARYDVSFNPAVLEFKAATSGKINGIDIPISQSSLISGKVIIEQNIPGVTGASGTGSLATLQFHVIGIENNTSDIAFSNGFLGDTGAGNIDNQPHEIPSQWTGTSVRIISAIGPILIIDPDPPSHDFGSVQEGQTTNWTFNVTNIGKGTLSWTLSSNQNWLTLNPTTGTTTTEIDTVTATVNTTGLVGGTSYSGTVTISTNGGNATGTMAVSVPTLPSDLTVTDLTWLPANSIDGNIVTFTATVNNIGQGKTGKDFYVRFDLDGISIGHRLIAGGLNAGATIPVTQTWVATPGTHTIKAVADENNAVTESNETNNELSKALNPIAFPDLTVSGLTIQPPNSINDGDLVTLTATVNNTGSGSTAREFYVRFEVDSVYLGHQKVSGLAAGSSATVNQTWTAKPGNHTAKVAADEYNVVAEASETNNELTQALPQVTAPDIIITDITFLPATINDGDIVTLTAAVKNAGLGNAANGFFIRFEVDGVFIGRQYIASLAAGATADVSQTWQAVTGSHTAKAIADEYNALIEGDETNNQMTKPLPAVPAPDFIIASLTSSPASGINDGDTVTLTATVNNTGDGSTTRDFYVRFEVDIVPIGTQKVSGLVAGGSATVSQTWVAKSGTHTAKAVADESNLVAESNEGNNALNLPLPEILAPDLTVTAFSYSPTSINDGDNVTFTATVKNVGTGITAQDFYVRFEIDSNYIGHQKVSGLAAGASIDVNQTWVSKSGGHTVRVVADEVNVIAESNEGNNELSQILPGILAPDLGITRIVCAPTDNINEGSQLTLTATVKNNGQGNTIREFYVRFEVDGQYLGRQPVSGLAASTSVDVNQTWVAQSGTHAAKAIADEYGSVSESDETNNQLQLALPQVLTSDLTINTLSYSPLANISDGENVILTAAVKNTGQGNTAKEFYVRFEVDGALVGRQKINGLAAGITVQVNQTWVAVAGDHTAKAIADEYNVVIESDETNNQLTQALPRILAPDLTITGITWLPETNISDGTTVTLTATVKNIGEGNTSRDFFIRIDVDGTAIGSQKVSGLAAGNSAAVNQTWIARPGGHSVKAIADETSVVTEANETNNELVQSLPNVAYPDLTVNSLTWSPQSILHGKIVYFSAVVENRGGATEREFMVRFEIDGVVVGRQKVSGLASTATVTQPWIAAYGAQNVKAVADEANAVVESDETNNALQVTLPTIPVPPQVRLTAPNGGEIWYGMQTVTWEASSPDPNLTVSLDLYDGLMYRPIAITTNSGAFEWDTRRLYDGSKTRDGTTFKVRITVSDSLGVSSLDDSNTWFTLFNTPVVTLSATPDRQRTIENARATYTLSIFNQQPHPDAFNLVVTNTNNAAVAQLSQDTISLTAWGKGSITLDVADETPGTYAVGVTIVSQTNSQVSASDSVVLEVIPAFTIALTPASNTTSISGVVSYDINLQNNQAVPDTFDLELTGVDATWVAMVASQPMSSGELKIIPARITVPDTASAGSFTILARAISHNLGTNKQASAGLNVVAEPIISGLSPLNGTYSGSMEVMVTWKTSVSSSSKVAYRIEGTPSYTEVTGDSGISHAVLITGLTRNTWYEFYAQSQNTHGTAQSEVRRLYIDNGITFNQRTYDFTILRNYEQRVTIGVRNTDDEPHQLSLSIESLPVDLAIGFVGEGSVDLPVMLQAGEGKNVILAFHAQDAQSQSYTLSLKLTASSTQPIYDYATVNLTIHVPLISFALSEISSDPTNLTKTIRLTNSGDPVTDFEVSGDASLASRVLFQPGVQHAYLGTGQWLDFKALPTLTADFTGLQGNIIARGAGQQATLPVSFILPAGKSVFIGSAAATLSNQADPSQFPTWEVTVVEYTENRLDLRAFSPSLNDTVEWIIETTRGVSYTPTQEELDMGLGVYHPTISYSESGGRIRTVFQGIVTSRGSELVRTKTRTLVGAYDQITTTIETGQDIYNRVENIQEQVQGFRDTQSFYDEALRQNAIDQNIYDALTVTNAAERIYNCGVNEVVSNLPGVGPMIDGTIQMGFGTLNAGVRIFTRHAMELNAVMDELFGANGWYCINGVKVEPGFEMPSTIQPENIAATGLGANLSQANNEEVQPHDAHFYVNGQEAGALMNTVPEGFYYFGFPPSWLNFTGNGVAHNDVRVSTTRLNPGHFIVATGFTIYALLRDVNIPVVAGNQQEANQYVRDISGTKVIMPDFAVYPEKVKFYPSNPRTGQATNINITVYNQGTLGGDAILQVFDTVNRSDTPFFSTRVMIPRFGSRVLTVPWQPAEGNHSITVKVNVPQVHREKSTGNNMATRNVTVLGGDTNLPSITNPQPVPDSTIKNNVPTVSADLADDSGINVTSVKITVDSVDVTAAATVSATHVSYTPPQALADGLHNVSVYAEDTSTSHNSKTLSWSFTVDTSDLTPPAITNPQPVPDSTIKNNTPAISADLSDASGINIASVKIKVDNVDVTGLATVTATHVSYTPAQPLADGVRNISVYAEDTHTNSRTLDWSFTIDSTPPQLSNLQVLNITGTTATVTWNTDEASDSLLLFGVDSGVYPWQKGNTDMVTSHSVALAGLTPETTYYYVVRSADALVNASESAESTFRTAVDQVVTFPDANLESAIRQAIAKPTGVIYRSELAALTSFTATNKGIVNLSGLENCTNLTTLVLPQNQISNLSPLSSLSNLKKLYISENQISNMLALAGLNNLSELSIAQNQISDISPISSLTSLTYLWIGNNQISNISAIAGLVNLQLLNMGVNQISDVSALAGLTGLRSLYLDSNEIVDITPLATLTHLGEGDQPLVETREGKLICLGLNGNHINDVNPLVINTGIGSGDGVDLRNNLLSVTSLGTHIPALQSRGVNVLFDAPTVATIWGVTWEVKGVILGGVTLTIDGGASVISGTTDGVYQLFATTTGTHTIVATKAGFKSQTRTVNVTDLGAVYTLDFKANYGLVPNAPNLTYVLACVNKWKFPPEGLGLSLTKVLSVINAWKFPI